MGHLQELERQLPEEHLPEMARVPLTTVILRIKQCNQGSPKELLVSPYLLARYLLDVRTSVLLVEVLKSHQVLLVGGPRTGVANWLA